MVSDLDKVGMQIDINGSGVMDVFNPYLPVSYVYTKVPLPAKNAGANYESKHEFDVPSDLLNPYFWVEDIYGKTDGYFYYFTPLGGVRWEVTLWGRFAYRIDANGNAFSSYPMWTEPLMRADAFVVIGGYRG